MREIKFRGWDGKNMIEPSKNFLIDSYAGYAFWSFGFELNMHPEWEVMQYTGLKDKNGTEIYEGDIIESANINVGKYLSFVGFQSGCFMFYPISTKSTSWGSLNNIQLSCKVIGNIYENPELLEKS